jgi:hypothetical protein
MQYKLGTKDKLILALTVDHKSIEQHKSDGSFPGNLYSKSLFLKLRYLGIYNSI